MGTSQSQPILASNGHTGSELPAPVRVQLSRAKGWKMPPNTVKVDRTTDWGNPHVPPTKDALGRIYAVLQFRQYCPPGSPLATMAGRFLRGKNLACWCPLDGACHADVLLELANAAPVDGASGRE